MKLVDVSVECFHTLFLNLCNVTIGVYGELLECFAVCKAFDEYLLFEGGAATKGDG